jgi:hypothetical protein
MVLLINDFTYKRLLITVKEKRICNVAFMNVISKVVISEVFISIVVVSIKLFLV